MWEVYVHECELYFTRAAASNFHIAGVTEVEVRGVIVGIIV